MVVKKTTTAKKTTAKPAAKKTATAKKTTTATKKTTAAKPVAKKTTATKPAATKSATEISVAGNKKIGTLKKEFNKSFPYLNLEFFIISESTVFIRRVPSPGIRAADDKTLASIRNKSCVGGDISISGNKKAITLENEFMKKYGLCVKICFHRSDGVWEMVGYGKDDKTLTAINKLCEQNGCKLGFRA